MPNDPETTTLTLETADGERLAAELSLPSSPRAAVVLAHPHPLHGGSMRSLVIGELFKGLPAHGIAALRFDFRGVGSSSGSHDHGGGERNDVAAAIDALAEAAPVQPLVLAGWSFGADVSSMVDDERLAGWFLIAPTLRTGTDAERVAAQDPRPTFVAVAENDEFLPPEPALAATAGWHATEVQVVAGASHYFMGRTDQLLTHLVAFVDSLS